MLLASIRLGFLLATLGASLHIAAAPQFFTLTGVRFNDSTALAGGYFSYDDATQMVANWNVHVPAANFLPAYTYLSNSSMSVSQIAGAVAPTLVLSAATDVP